MGDRPGSLSKAGQPLTSVRTGFCRAMTAALPEGWQVIMAPGSRSRTSGNGGNGARTRVLLLVAPSCNHALP